MATDDILGGQLAAENIHSSLRKAEKIIVVTGYEHQNLSRRLMGFFEYLEEKGIMRQQITVYKNINTYKDGQAIASTIATRNKLKTGFTSLFVTNDYVAMGVQEGLMQLNLPLPSQIRMVGYDNIEFSGRCRIPLTTIEQPQKDIGIIASMELLERINNPDREVKSYTLPPLLVKRESCP